MLQRFYTVLLFAEPFNVFIHLILILKSQYQCIITVVLEVMFLSHMT